MIADPSRRKPLACRPLGAFTLLEVLVTLALIGLLAALVAGASATLLRDKAATGEDILRNAVLRARRHAIEGWMEVQLSYSAKEKTFVELSRNGEKKFQTESRGELLIDFLPVQQDYSMYLGGVVAEGGALPHITFYPDGGCSPFRAQIRTGGGARVLSFDPWTCAPMLEGRK